MTPPTSIGKYFLISEERLTGLETIYNIAHETCEEIRSSPAPAVQASSNPPHELRMFLRKTIQNSGESFYRSFNDLDILQNIAGEFLGHNEDWCINHQGTYGYEDIISRGFSNNQAKWLTLLAFDLRKEKQCNTKQCETCRLAELRGCMYHGYPKDTIPPSCEYKIGIHAEGMQQAPMAETTFINMGKRDSVKDYFFLDRSPLREQEYELELKDEGKPGCFGAIGLPGKRNDPGCPCGWRDRCRQAQDDA